MQSPRGWTIYRAAYADHPIKEYNASPLIRALEILPNHLELQAKLTAFPQWSAADRLMPREVRIQKLILGMYKFFLGLPRTVELYELIHTMVCTGYLDRIPHSAADQARRQDVYERHQRRETFTVEDVDEEAVDLSAALIGIPGGGKTQGVKHTTRDLRRVIYHPDLDIYQIPALLIQMPYKGVSVLSLGERIVRALDRAFPQANYAKHYLSGRRPNAENLFMTAVQLMQTHYVGILIIDESQNKEYRSKSVSRRGANESDGQSPLATLLISAMNASNIPILLTGTPELPELLGVRMSMLRRLVGRGMRVWKSLTLTKNAGPAGSVEMGEFDTLLTVLWDFQWTKTEFKYSLRMRNLFYYYSQGVIDVLIKLFQDVQLRAIRNGGDEIVDEALVHEVATEELKALTNLTAGMRKEDAEVTRRAVDLAAYLRIDPHVLTPERKLVKDAIDGKDENFEYSSDEDEDEGGSAGPDALSRTPESEAGPKKRTSFKNPPRRRAKPHESLPNSRSAQKKSVPPAIKPVVDLNKELNR